MMLGSLFYGGSSGRRPADALSSFDAELLTLINNHRSSQGADPLVEWVPLSGAALNWSQTMQGAATPCDSGDFRHDTSANASTTGTPPGTSLWAENIAWGCGSNGIAGPNPFTYRNLPAPCLGQLEYTTPLFQFCQWIDSTSHRTALENPGFAHIGLGTTTATGSGATSRWSTARFTTAPIDPCDPSGVGASCLGTPGDANCNGLVNAADAQFVLEHGVGSRADGGDCLVAIDELNAVAGDLNIDGTTNILDALHIAQCSIGVDLDWCPE